MNRNLKAVQKLESNGQTVSADDACLTLLDSSFNLASTNQNFCKDFDWSPKIWEKVIAEVGTLVQEASTNWDTRRFTPNAEADYIRNLFDQPLPERSVSFSELMASMRQLIECSGYNGHPRWLAYITSSPDPVGVLGAFFTAAINQNNNLWRIAPAATSIELQCIEWFKEMFDLAESWEGVFSSGGQLSNIIACATARHLKCPWDVRRHGVVGPAGSGRLRVYTSDQAHYCHHQAVELLGMGSEAIRLVPSDHAYRMDVNVLSEMIAEDKARGDIPIAVIATAGTVATGAIDPLAELRTLTYQENMWLHIDGAYGLPAYLVPEISPQLVAMQAADSLSFDPHKWFYSPIDAGVTLVRHTGALQQAFGMKVTYLDQSALNNCSLDLVDFTPENSRPARAIKVWLSLMAHGIERFRNQIAQDITLAQRMARYIQAVDTLALLTEPSLSIVCWRVEPPSLHGNEEALNTLQLAIIEALEKRGIAFLSKAQLQDDKIALRACIVNFRTGVGDVEAALRASKEIGLELADSKA